MPDATDAPHAPLSTIATLRPVWERFRSGGVAICPSCGSPMALAVDGTIDVYRFVCVQCGTASPWFEAKLARIAIKGQSGDLGASDE
jgi:ribosomal protein S27AE